MSTIEKDMLFIKSRTTGFASPAESYVDKRLDLNELIAINPLTTFYFRYKGPDTLGVKNGNILVIDKSVDPVEDDLVILSDTSCFKIRKFEGQSNVWGKVSWVLNKL